MNSRLTDPHAADMPTEIMGKPGKTETGLSAEMSINLHPKLLVAQCSATPASVAATPPCSATPLQRQLDVRHSCPFKGNRCDRAF